MPHERTLPKAKSDRLELLRATRANLDPIWGLSLAAGLSERSCPTAPPLATAVDDDGFRHELWRVTDPARIEAIADAVGARRAGARRRSPPLRDGVQLPRRAPGQGVDDPGADAIMTLVVELAPEQLCVRAIHRLLAGVGRRRPARRGSHDARSTVRDAGANVPEGVAALRRPMRAERRPRAGRPGRARARSCRRAALDARMRRRCRRSCARSTRPASTSASLPRGAGRRRSPTATTRSTVAAHVAKGNADAAVLLRPVTVETIRAAAAAGLRMPEKTTFFAPKPRTGMVFRSLDD